VAIRAGSADEAYSEVSMMRAPEAEMMKMPLGFR
jgi:hypothetical protein